MAGASSSVTALVPSPLFLLFTFAADNAVGALDDTAIRAHSEIVGTAGLVLCVGEEGQRGGRVMRQ